MELKKPLIELHQVFKTYQQKNKPQVTAVKNLNLEVDKGDFLIITGRSGCGKTTLLNLVSGLTSPTSGQVLMDHIEVWKLPDQEQSKLRNQKIGFVFQFPSLIPSLNALENTILPTIVNKEMDQGVMMEQAKGLLVEVGLADKFYSLPRQLSAGQQQRVVIARSLINDPELLLADEPTSNLDEKTEQEIMALFNQIHQERAITILLVTHTAELVPFGNRSIRMSVGEIVS